MRHFRLPALFCLFALPIFASAATVTARPHAASARSVSQQALLISDLHLNPFAVPGLVPRLQKAPVGRWDAILRAAQLKTARQNPAHFYGRYGKDSNILLLDSAFAAMRHTVPHPAFILLGGDLLAHHYHRQFLLATRERSQADYSAFVHKTFAFIALRLRQSFPGVLIAPVIGNNDSDCGDYESRPGQPFMSITASAWRESFLPLTKMRHAAAQFAAGGFYSLRLPVSGAPLRLIALNDVFWSPNYANRCGRQEGARAPQAEMDWLRATLFQAAERGERVWILAHIPPGADVFSSLHRGAKLCGAPPVTFLAPAFNRQFITLLRQYSNTVQLAVFGHTHQDEFRLVTAGPPTNGLEATASSEQAVPLKIVPSITPIFGNNPAFTVIRLSQGAVNEARVYSLPGLAKGARWSMEYDFDNAYGLRGLTAADFVRLNAELRQPGAARARYQTDYTVSSGNSNLTRKAWAPYACGITALSGKAFTRCACK